MCLPIIFALSWSTMTLFLQNLRYRSRFLDLWNNLFSPVDVTICAKGTASGKRRFLWYSDLDWRTKKRSMQTWCAKVSDVICLCFYLLFFPILYLKWVSKNIYLIIIYICCVTFWVSDPICCVFPPCFWYMF